MKFRRVSESLRDTGFRCSREAYSVLKDVKRVTRLKWIAGKTYSTESDAAAVWAEQYRLLGEEYEFAALIYSSMVEGEKLGLRFMQLSY